MMLHQLQSVASRRRAAEAFLCGTQVTTNRFPNGDHQAIIREVLPGEAEDGPRLRVDMVVVVVVVVGFGLMWFMSQLARVSQEPPQALPA